ncbi:hypothetical protein LTSEMIN_5574, partial [Salmonella enterica subsp. enterica serovar Minnesota str. A4-603]
MRQQQDVGQRLCGSQNGLLAQLHEDTGIYCPVALRL